MTRHPPSPRSLPEFQRLFPDEAACADYLYSRRFPDGFVCPTCGDDREPGRVSTRPMVLRCRNGQHETSLTANTVMHRAKMPVCVWFWGAFLVTGLTPGLSALQFQKQLGIGRYETAFQMLHKLRSAMVRPDRDTIGGGYPVEVDEKWVGGATQGEGRGKHHKTLVIGAVEVRPRSAIPAGGQDPNLPTGQAPPDPEEDRRGAARKGLRRKTGPKSPKGGHGRSLVAGRLRLQVVPGRKRTDLEPFVQGAVLPGTTVRTDGWTGYDLLSGLGYVHHRVAARGDHAVTGQHLPLIHIVFGNLDAWLLGTHHGVSPQHLQAYLNEFCFRFNRRFWPMSSFDALLGIGSGICPPTYRGLYTGTWRHPASWQPGAGGTP